MIINATRAFLFCACMFCLAWSACPQPLPPVPPVPAPDAAPSIYQASCANLAKLGCPEGLAANCAAVFEQAQTARMADLKPACLTAATTQAAARGCGSVRCQP